MGSNQRDASGRTHMGLRMLAAATMALGATPAAAQDLVHRFINPSFGGNPFYSEHLIAIANIHRPSQPTTPTPTQEELLAQQIRARLLAQLQGNILDRIQAAAVGDSGDFEVGNQRISFARTATETRITFTNTSTGEVNTVVLPAASATASAAAGQGAATAAAASPTLAAEQALSTGGVSTGIASGRPGATGPSILRSAEASLLAANSGTNGAGTSALPPY